MRSSLALAVAIHVAAALAMPRAAPVAMRHVDRVTRFVDVDLGTTRPPPPVPTPLAATRPLDRPRLPARAPRAPAPSLPEAAAVLTKKDDPGDLVDFGDTFVSGSAAEYKGGPSVAGGPLAQAPPGMASLVGRSAASAPAASGPDRTRHAHLADSRWRCPFPPEADTAQIDSAVVRLRVDVDASGRAQHASVLKDPGFGFGREAARCALASAWTAALGRGGAPEDASAVVDVRFER